MNTKVETSPSRVSSDKQEELLREDCVATLLKKCADFAQIFFELVWLV